jgi:hypothetical protein
MKITIENTSRLTSVNGVPARVWEGATDSGIPVICLVTRVAVKNGLPTAQFEAELKEQKPPSEDACEAIPLRMIL